MDETDEIVRFIENRLLDDGVWWAEVYAMPWDRLDSRQKWLAVWYALSIEKDNIRGMMFLKRLLTTKDQSIPPEGVRLLAELIFPANFETPHFDMELSKKDTKAGTTYARRYVKDLKRTKPIIDGMRKNNLSKTAAIEAFCEGSVRHAFRTFTPLKEGGKPFAPWEDD